MKAKLLLTALALVGGCEKPPANPPGVEDQPSTKVAASNLAKQPSEGAADAAQAVGADSPGTTVTPPTAFEKSDGGSTVADGKAGDPRQAAGGPGDKLDKDAKAVFQAAPGIKLKGDVELEELASGGVKIEVDVEKAPPGVKGIHIHQIPDCTNIPGKSMGEHFAPDAKEHGMPTAGGPHHLGDLGNLTIDEDGEGELEITIAGANLREHDPHSFLGRAVVIHEKKDEGSSSQPSGNAGKPIACAIIKPE
ncbi:MAG: superoxide dismutase family protein [Polyangiales bacterium]